MPRQAPVYLAHRYSNSRYIGKAKLDLDRFDRYTMVVSQDVSTGECASLIGHWKALFCHLHRPDRSRGSRFSSQSIGSSGGGRGRPRSLLRLRRRHHAIGIRRWQSCALSVPRTARGERSLRFARRDADQIRQLCDRRFGAAGGPLKARSLGGALQRSGLLIGQPTA